MIQKLDNGVWVEIQSTDELSIGDTYRIAVGGDVSQGTNGWQQQIWLGEVTNQRQYYVSLTDVLVNGGSVLNSGNNYTGNVGQPFELQLDIRKTEDDTIFAINQTRSIVVEGVLGSMAQVRPAVFTAGLGSITLDTTSAGTFNLSEVGLNYPINNPNNFLDFRAPDGSESLVLTITD